MALTKYKLGELIEQSTEKNSQNIYVLNDVKGLSIQKDFIETKADMENVSLLPYLIVKPSWFAYVTVTSRNGEKITLAYNNNNKIFIVSSSYVVFKIKELDKLLPEYLFMYFNRTEFDRYSRFNSWGSARETFDFETMCDIEIELPDISIQQKYVNIYNAMVANQKVYEKGLDDLKLVCDAYIENLKKDYKSEQIGKYINSIDEKNIDLKIKLVQGVDVNMQFIPAKREAIDKKSANIVRIGQFAYNKVIKCNGTKLPIAIRDKQDCIVSSSYQVFDVIKKDTLLAEYLFLWLTRNETQRYCGFMSWGSTRDTFSYDELCKLEIPIPPLEIQKSIADVYSVYLKRKKISNKLKEKIKEICPILIKGALDEGRKNA